jgi:3-oxoadipate enol-lactonase
MNQADFIASDGAFIAYRVDGPETAPVVVLSNSLGTTTSMWSEQVRSLAADFRVVRYDSRGHGRSSVPHGNYSISRLGMDVVELMKSLEAQKYSFCGISLGGMVGQWLGVHARERLDGLVLCNTSAFMGPASWETRMQAIRKGGMKSIAEAVLDRWFTQEFRQKDPATVAKMLDTFLTLDPEGYSGCCAAIRDMDQRGSVSAITTPCLVIAGSEDRATPPDHSEFLASSIPSARLEVLPTAHLSNVEKAPEFTRVLQDFLTGYRVRSAGMASYNGRH